MMSNLKQIAQIMKGRDPQSVVMEMVGNQTINDPGVMQLIKFAQSGDTNNFANFANALFQQQGLDLNQELSDFMELMK